MKRHYHQQLFGRKPSWHRAYRRIIRFGVYTHGYQSTARRCKRAYASANVYNVQHTLPNFFLLTNYFETLVSSVVWMPCIGNYCQTIQKNIRQICPPNVFYASVCRLASTRFFHAWYGREASVISASGHLLSFSGTDTIPAIEFLEKYYNANSDTELVGGSVAATEHSVMCMGTIEDEIGTFKRLICEVYPEGIVSIVSDTWNLWTVLTDYLPKLKKEVLNRNGKVVIRPDSGDPVDIICGNENAKNDNEQKGVIQLLWDTFGGTTNAKGYKELDGHIGAIYGDSITLARATQICERLKAKGFASTNIVLGIGSYTYQYNTRDTFGFAMKATYGEVNGEGRAIFKDPITDDGTKKIGKRIDKNRPSQWNIQAK